MRIIQYIDTLNTGGSERMAVNISYALKADGQEVMMIVSRSLGGLQNKLSGEVELVLLEKKVFYDWPAFLKLLQTIKRFQPDVLHAHSSSIIWGILAKMISKHSFQLVFHDHYGMSEQLTDKDRALLRLLSGKIDKVIAVNERLKNWNIQNLNVSEDQIAYIPNFPYLSMQGERTEKGYIQIVCLANLRPQKDHKTLIQAFSILVKCNSEKEFRLVLAGNALEDAYQKEIEQEIAHKGLTGRITITGAVNDVESLLLESDLGVLSSISEGLPVSLLEYGLAGLPVVVTNVGQCADVVGHGKFGKVIPPQNAEAMAEAFGYLIQHPQDAKGMGLAFQKHVEEKYGAKKFLQSYYELIAS
ncbi:glycosyltransferase [Cecembia rubra]|uniref:Glycosyltransferase involved in cell wall biosynthesis n=1 Tax=Cecembia rubra TaxID=1485585 RepID=A0A2P8E3C6_9BACT|nr:glycosyltransferase [Cecembia rubra]PSL03960.1 glycosyltransferase involved in cell wall biosynthesis [Cecembia rubra]